MSKYTYEWYLSSEWFKQKKVYDNIDFASCYCVPLTLCKEGIPYSFSANTLTASIDSWKFKTKFKILVKNDNGEMSGNADEYMLQVQNAATNQYAESLGAFIINPQNSCPIIGNGSSNDKGKTGGVQEPDGIAFYFGSFSIASGDNVKFALQKGNTKKYYTVTGKTLSTSNDKCVNIAMNYSSFVAE